ncbi:transposase [Rhizobium tubonense]
MVSHRTRRYGLFVDFRWAHNGGNRHCPRCGCLEPYSVRRRRFRYSVGM